ncbi:MAG: Holliday junction resolvase RuvX [Candidatus Avilachnospira sp.]|jgi:putative Holliday junction resolvase
MRVLGLDYGSKTVGVALTDEMGIIASPLETIERDMESKIRPTLRRIEELVHKYEVSFIVLGYPVKMSGEVGERALKTEEFKVLLEKRLGESVPVRLWDERLSTADAREILDESGIKRSEQKKYIDKIAAALILEDYMKNSKDYACNS